MDIVAVVITGVEDERVGFEDGGFFGEFLCEVTLGALDRTVEEPADEAEREDVAAFEDALVVEAAVGEGRLCHRCDGHLDDLSCDVELFKRFVGGEKRFFEVCFLKRVDVDYDYAAGFEEFDILL